ncbi:MAG TPA: GAF domain-containing protein [Candidatus Krumholzibacteria bacterium]|nr:GAF domain-containing protein [Candidatus Krumholzibacteria bacterium]
MEKTQLTVAELSSLLRMIQVIPDADNVGRIHQMLLAFCTAWRTIGVRRAFLLLVDERGRMIRGHLGAEQTLAEDAEPVSSFESLARRVVESTQRIETSDLTLKTRTFSVPLDWQRCGVARAAGTGVPLLADRRMSEFGSDPFFDFFGTQAYVAIPIRVRGKVAAVLAADHGDLPERIGVEDISLVYSMAQQAATAIERLQETGDNSRKFRVLRKLQDILAAAEDTRRFADSLSAVLSMVSRAIGGNGILMKDLVRNKTTHVKSVDELDTGDRDTDIALTNAFDDILEKVSGTGKPVRGDSAHPMLNETAAQAVQHFLALPLVAGGEALGGIAVYSETRSADEDQAEFSARDRLFLELCAGMLAERLDSLYKSEQHRRTEGMLDEVQSNLVRERATARLDARAHEQYAELAGRIRALRAMIGGGQAPEVLLAQSQEALDAMEKALHAFEAEASTMKSSLQLVDLFALVREVAARWTPVVSASGVDATVRIPARGPTLLMDRSSVLLALGNILDVLARHLIKDDRVLIECTASEGRAVILIADTAGNVDGTLLSRLFMPFGPGRGEDDPHAAMSAAGDILQRHAGEITVKSSPSWKTILALSFRVAANSDRRQTPSERRRRRERRAAGE